MTFHLVPRESWNEGRPAPESLLPAGEVLVYAQGSYEPAFVVPLGEPVRLPPGSWSWIGEAPGYVTAAGGRLTVGEVARPGQAEEKDVVWPALPACELRLAGDWRGVERLDAVSLTGSAVYPVVKPREGRTRKVPAGSWIVYGVRGGALTGLGAPGRCRAGEVVDLPPPVLPPGDRQDLVVHARLPELPAASGEDGPEGGDATLTLRPANAEPLLPAAVFRAGRHRTFFFRRLAAAGPLEIALHHPRLKTVRQPLEPLGGSAREITLEPVPRTALELELDYRPARPHGRQELEVIRCDGVRLVPDDCLPVARHPLREGFARYRFEDLDGGSYRVDARIGDEGVQGLGRGLWLEVGPTSPPILRPPPLELVEMEVHGHLLEDGEPVPGEVVLEPRSKALPLRRAPTGEDLLYRLHFFGRMPGDFERGLLPEELADLDGADLLGLWGGYEIRACGGSGRCRSLPLRSFLVGGGRLDLDLGGERGLEVTVVDRETGEPLPRVPVLVRGGGGEERLVFHRGDTWWLPTHGGEATPRRTGGDGVARVRGLAAGPVSWGVKAPGYQPARGRATVPPSGWEPVRAALEREDGAGEAELRFPDGEPVAGGFVLVFGPDGRRRPGCGGATSASGGVRLREGCLAGGRAVLLHPGARLPVLDGDLLAGTGRATVDRAPLPAPRLRVVDAAGAPLPGVPVEVLAGGLRIGPDELVASLARFVQPLFHLTGPGGEIELRGVDPRAPDPPEVRLRWNGAAVPVPLAGWRPGETVEVVLDR